MKLFLLATAFAGLSLTALAAPPSVGYSVGRPRDLPQYDTTKAQPLTFTGPAVVGGPNVTITGTAKEIYEQIHKLNPSYDPWDFPDYQERMAAQGVTKESRRAQLDSAATRKKKAAEKAGTSKRDLGPLAKRDWITCDPEGWEVGNWPMQCTEGLQYLNNLNGYCGAPAGWGGCSRVSCSTNCGIFLCNDNPYPIWVWCGNLVGDVFDIIGECETVWDDWVASVKGQIFRDGPPAWNTIIKSQSC